MKRIPRVFELSVPEQRIVIALIVLLMLGFYIAHRVEKNRERITPVEQEIFVSSPSPSAPMSQEVEP